MTLHELHEQEEEALRQQHTPSLAQTLLPLMHSIYTREEKVLARTLPLTITERHVQKLSQLRASAPLPFHIEFPNYPFWCEWFHNTLWLLATAHRHLRFFEVLRLHIHFIRVQVDSGPIVRLTALQDGCSMLLMRVAIPFCVYFPKTFHQQEKLCGALILRISARRGHAYRQLLPPSVVQQCNCVMHVFVKRNFGLNGATLCLLLP